jgi:putative transposase
MPRFRRLSAGGYCFHAVNRSNPGIKVFDSDAKCLAFLHLIRQGIQRIPLRLIAYCLMPNHFHLVLWPTADGDMSRWMQWLLTSHVRKHHHRHGTYGRIWQGRFKAFPIQQDLHLLNVLRYVERNPLRANLVASAEDWHWSSLSRHATVPLALDEGPVARFDGWIKYVNQPQTKSELASIRTSARRERPYGEEAWTKRTAEELGLEFTLRNAGRPLGIEKKENVPNSPLVVPAR